ncbi:MAG: hypothetical protein C0428_12125 [Polaromonas sp.]|nr:hypothetical protein [Polaromonas sp.]
MQYFQFLEDLAKLNGVVFAAATEMSLNSPDLASHHQSMQAEAVVKYKEKMLHESMRQALTDLSNAVKKLPPNLYAQLMFQITLFHDVVARGVLYFVQRFPQTLGEIRWRVDQKDVIPTEYEKVFRRMLPAILQSISMREPIMMVQGFDYSYLKNYEFPPGEKPTFLQSTYNLPDADGLDLGKMVGGNFKFVDSKKVIGVQIADLLASGIRRFLKSEFLDNDTAAMLLGRLTVQAQKSKLPLKLVALSTDAIVKGSLAKRLKLLDKHARPMLI